jgi:hypothetical protein
VRAINAANNDTTANGRCAKGSGADRIVLPWGNTQRLTTGLPTIRSTITIVGNNSTIRRAQTAPEFGILSVGETGNLTLNRLTLTGGSTDGSAGGVFNRGNTTINSSTVSGNAADERGGGVRSAGDAATLTINKSTLSGNTAHDFEGGGIIIAYDYAGSNRITKTTISGNSASTGAGIELFSAALRLVSSTVSGNSTGGGVLFEGYDNVSRLTMTNSTISGNSGSGVICRDGSGTITNSTITGNVSSGVAINFCEQISTLAAP